jgi:hypothetical protein
MIVSVSKSLLNPISLPGMGRSMELSGLSEQEMLDIKSAFSRQELYIEFVEETGTEIPVTQLWANPHANQLTLFIQ